MQQSNSSEQEKRYEPQAEEPRPQEKVKVETTEQKEFREKLKIPETQKPEMPKDEKIPSGGPGDQAAQSRATSQTQKTDGQIKKEKASKIKGQLNIKIEQNTPRERKTSGQLENWHNDNVLRQNID